MSAAVRHVGVWIVIVAALLCGAVLAQTLGPLTNARYYRLPLAPLDPDTTIDTVGDALGGGCWAVYIYSTDEEFGMVNLGSVPCRK